MSEPQLHLNLDGDRAVYGPGEGLIGSWRIDRLTPGEIKAVELSVLWHTEGKGDEDLGVHHFARVTADEALASGGEPRAFSVLLPNSPLSYDGLVVKVRWCVRLRAFLQRGRELVFDLPFQLGSVPGPPAGAPPSDGGSGAGHEQGEGSNGHPPEGGAPT